MQAADPSFHLPSALCGVLSIKITSTAPPDRITHTLRTNSPENGSMRRENTTSLDALASLTQWQRETKHANQANKIDGGKKRVAERVT